MQEGEARRELEVTSQELLRCITALEGVTDEIEDLRSKNREADAYVARAKEAAEAERRTLQATSDRDRMKLGELAASHEQVCCIGLSTECQMQKAA